MNSQCFTNFPMEVKILDKEAYQDVEVLQKGTLGSAGLDLRVCLDKDFLNIYPNQVVLVGTGLAIHIADSSFVGLIVPRSGKGHTKGLIIGNLTGVIDSDYQGELKISLWNRGEQVITVYPGEAVAQLLIVPLGKPIITIVEEFSTPTSRGGNGFGSTGG